MGGCSGTKLVMVGEVWVWPADGSHGCDWTPAARAQCARAVSGAASDARDVMRGYNRGHDIRVGGVISGYAGIMGRCTRVPLPGPAGGVIRGYARLPCLHCPCVPRRPIRTSPPRRQAELHLRRLAARGRWRPAPGPAALRPGPHPAPDWCPPPCPAPALSPAPFPAPPCRHELGEIPGDPYQYSCISIYRYIDIVLIYTRRERLICALRAPPAPRAPPAASARTARCAGSRGLAWGVPTGGPAGACGHSAISRRRQSASSTPVHNRA
jgi:hypothetical protein